MWREIVVLFLGGFMLTGCLSVGPPRGLEPIKDFDVSRYTGVWYEVARFDHRFERGLTHVTANYVPLENGTIRVINRGFDPKNNKWKEAVGKAKFIGPRNVASLKVSFFGPFYAGYHVVALDKEGYQHALVTSGSRKYLWILSRTPEMAPDVMEYYVATAEEMGFDTGKFIWVEQSKTHETSGKMP